MSEWNAEERFCDHDREFLFLYNFFSKCAAMLSFVRGTAASGGLQRSKGGHDAGEVC